MLVAALVGIMMAIVIGVSLLPVITDSLKQVTEDATDEPAVEALVSILPYVFVSVVILGAVAWIGGGLPGRGDRSDGRDRRDYVEGPFDWKALGRDLKDAYAAKFGWRDRPFEKAVDKHLKEVCHSSEITTRGVARTWLKSMTSSLNVPREIPEEKVSSSGKGSTSEELVGKGYE